MTVKILLVEDNKTWQKTLTRFLKNLKVAHEITIVNSYVDALGLAINQNFDLLITDLRLKENEKENHEGLSLVKHVKEAKPKFPCIIVTNYPNDDLKRKADDAGVVAFLNKTGLTALEFIDAVNKAITLIERDAFMLMPFTRELLPIWKLLQQTFKNTPINIKRADNSKRTRVIIDQIYEDIQNVDYVIADLTDQNANVLHELGYAHAQGKSVISITQSINDVPEQLQGFYLIKYGNQIGDGEKLALNLLESIDALEEDRSEEPFAFFKRDKNINVSLNSCLVLAGRNVDSNFEFVIDQLNQDIQCKFTWEKDIFGVGHELEEIWKEMQAASYCIAYLNDREPSVYYLTGLAIGLGKDLIIFTKGNRKNPFDFRTRSSIKLTNSLKGAQKAMDAFKKVYSQFASAQAQGDSEKLKLEAKTDIGDVLNRLMSSGKVAERLKKHFSIEEMQSLLFSLDEDYEGITGPNSTKGQAAVDITGYFQRQGRLEILAQKMINSRPDVDW